MASGAADELLRGPDLNVLLIQRSCRRWHDCGCQNTANRRRGHVTSPLNQPHTKQNSDYLVIRPNLFTTFDRPAWNSIKDGYKHISSAEVINKYLIFLWHFRCAPFNLVVDLCGRFSFNNIATAFSVDRHTGFPRPYINNTHVLRTPLFEPRSGIPLTKIRRSSELSSPTSSSITRLRWIPQDSHSIFTHTRWLTPRTMIFLPRKQLYHLGLSTELSWKYRYRIRS